MRSPALEAGLPGRGESWTTESAAAAKAALREKAITRRRTAHGRYCRKEPESWRPASTLKEEADRRPGELPFCDEAPPRSAEARRGGKAARTGTARGYREGPRLLSGARSSQERPGRTRTAIKRIRHMRLAALFETRALATTQLLSLGFASTFRRAPRSRAERKELRGSLGRLSRGRASKELRGRARLRCGARRTVTESLMHFGACPGTSGTLKGLQRASARLNIPLETK